MQFKCRIRDVTCKPLCPQAEQGHWELRCELELSQFVHQVGPVSTYQGEGILGCCCGKDNGWEVGKCSPIKGGSSVYDSWGTRKGNLLYFLGQISECLRYQNQALPFLFLLECQTGMLRWGGD